MATDASTDALRAGAEALLSEDTAAQSFISAILDAAGPIAVLDQRGRILQLNRACTRMLDQRQPAAGRELWDVFATSPAQRARGRQHLLAALAGGEPPAWEATFVGGDGVQRNVAWSFAPLAERGEGLRQAIASGNDTTALKILQAQLVVSERLAPIGRLAAGVGHEINNPLTYVKSSLELTTSLLNGSHVERSKLKHALDVAMEGVERIRLIVDDLRVFSSPDGRAVDAIDVRPLLDSCVQLATNEIRHRARLLVSFGEVPKVTANAGRLSQVFLNLLVNAAQSIAPGHANDNEIALTVRADPSGGVIVEFRDSGSGIAREDLPRIFEPFFTTKSVGEGTGLGLTICREIIAELGGRLSVESTPGRGTAFRVWLATAAVDEAPAMPRRARATSAVPITRRSILVIDDEQRITESFVLLLGDKHHVETAASGRDALELCRKREFDVIFCDLRMPEVGGDEIYRSLRRQNAAQAKRIVFMTGGLGGESDLRALLDGDVAILRKPFSVRELTAVLEERFARATPPAAPTSLAAWPTAPIRRASG